MTLTPRELDEMERDESVDVDPDWERENMPVGACDECGSNVYEDDLYADENLCDQCAWHMEQARKDSR